MRPLNWLFVQFMRHLRQRRLEDCERRIRTFRQSDSGELLGRLLRHAARTVPFYRGLDGARLPEFPILTKELLLREAERLCSSAPAVGTYRNASGGSTGQPVSFLQDEVYADWARAAERYWLRHFCGADFMTTRKVVLWGSDKDFDRQRARLKTRLSDWLTGSVFLNTFTLTPELMDRYLAVLERVRPDWIKGYAGSLYRMALHAEERGVRPPSPRFLFSSAEMLLPPMRAKIEQVFGARVFDYYGSREVGAIAGECRSSRRHVFSFNCAVEVVDEEGRPATPGQEGRVLVTTLHNYSMPLIRYEIGDLAVAGGPCPCGSELPVLERICGRVTDHFRTAQGALVHGEYFTHLFYFVDWLAEFQVVQEALDRVAVLYVPRGAPDEARMRAIDSGIREKLGPCTIDWRPVAEVPKTPHGKRLFTRSLVTGNSPGQGRSL